jgi:4-hydroxy-tetrahydrodipicolinate synthase
MSIKKADLKQWARENMKGVENTIFPSFTPDMKHLDEEGIRLDVRQSIKHGFYSTMCATESGLTLQESKQFVGIVAAEAQGKIVVTTSLILDTFDDNMELMQHAENVGVSGVLLGYPPGFFPRTAGEVYDATKRFCDATAMHVTLYPSPHFHFNRFHPSGFPMEILEKVAAIENVVAIKVGEMGLFAHCHALVGDKLLVGCPIERDVPALVRGFNMQWMGAGCYEVFQSPEKPYLVEYFNLLLAGKFADAMEIYWKLTPARVIFEEQFNKTVMSGTYNWHQQKYYQWCVGGNGGLTRQPAMKVHTFEMQATDMGFRMIGIEPRQNPEEFVMGRCNYERAGIVPLVPKTFMHEPKNGKPALAAQR